MEDGPRAGWDAVAAVLAGAIAGLPERASPAVIASGSRPGMPPFGVGTDLVVQCGPGETAQLKLVRSRETSQLQWVLHSLHYPQGRDRDFMVGSGWYSVDLRPPVPDAAGGLCDRLLAAHAAGRTAGDRQAAAFTVTGANPRAEDADFSGWRGYRLLLDVPGGQATFAYRGGCWDLLRAPSGPARPAPLDPWIDLTGGFLITDGNAHGALTGHLVAALRSPSSALQRAGPAGIRCPASPGPPHREPGAGPEL